MNRIKNIAFSTLLAMGAFSAVTYTSCSKEETPVDPCATVTCYNGGSCNSSGTCDCPIGYTGATCESETRSLYVGDYKGSGSDNSGGTYTNWTFSFKSGSASTLTSMTVDVKNTAGSTVLSLPVTLDLTASPTTYSIASTVVGSYTFSGTGTISETSASCVLNQTGTPNLVITFNSLARQ